MKLVKAIVRPNKVNEVRDALENLNAGGMTVTEVRGPRRAEGAHRDLSRQGNTTLTLLAKDLHRTSFAPKNICPGTSFKALYSWRAGIGEKLVKGLAFSLLAGLTTILQLFPLG